MNYVKVPYNDWIAICNAVRALANEQSLYTSDATGQEIVDVISAVNNVLSSVIGVGNNA